MSGQVAFHTSRHPDFHTAGMSGAPQTAELNHLGTMLCWPVRIDKFGN